MPSGADRQRAGAWFVHEPALSHPAVQPLARRHLQEDQMLVHGPAEICGMLETHAQQPNAILAAWCSSDHDGWWRAIGLRTVNFI